MSKSSSQRREWFLRQPFTAGAHDGVVDPTTPTWALYATFAERWNEAEKRRKKEPGTGCKLLHKGSHNLYHQLRYLCARQLEELRLANPELYAYYMLESPAFPVYFGKAAVAKLIGSYTGSTPAAKTIYNTLGRLADANMDGKALLALPPGLASRREKPILTHGKVEQTNFERRCSRSDDGSVNLTFRIKRGRGDLKAWLPREMFVFNLDPAKFLSADNQALREDKGKLLHPLKENLIETKSITYDRPVPGHCGAAQPFLTGLRPDMLGNRAESNSSGNSKSPGAPGGDFLKIISETSIPADVFDQNMKKISRKSDAIDRLERRIPKDNVKSFCLFYLEIMLRRLIFPKLTDGYWESISVHVKEMLHHHLERLDLPIWSSFRLVNRGIFLAHRYMRAHPDALDKGGNPMYPNGMPRYMPLQYLRVDMPNGWFRQVMDVWVKNELKTIHRLTNKDDFMAWQSVANRAEELIRLVAIRMREKGYTAAMAEAEQARQTLEILAKQANLPPATKQKIIQEFTARTAVLRDELMSGGDNDAADNLAEFFNQSNKKAA